MRRLASFVSGVALFVISTFGCAPQLEAPVEQAIIADRASCFQFLRAHPERVFGDAEAAEPDPTTPSPPCDLLSTRLDAILLRNPGDAWARTERAEARHVLAREHAAYRRATGHADPLAESEAERQRWERFLADWNRTYPDLAYFRLLHQQQPDLTPTLVARQRLLLADFFVLNAQHAARLEAACASGDPGCDRELLDLVAGELFHLAAWTSGEALAALPEPTDPAESYNLALLREELCASWVLSYEGYLAFRNLSGLDASYALTPCLIESSDARWELPAEVPLEWRVASLDGASYQSLSRFYESRRSRLINTDDAVDFGADGTLVAPRSTLARLVAYDQNGIAAQLAGDLLSACASGVCEAFPERTLATAGPLARWLLHWREDLGSVVASEPN